MRTATCAHCSPFTPTALRYIALIARAALRKSHVERDRSLKFDLADHSAFLVQEDKARMAMKEQVCDQKIQWLVSSPPWRYVTRVKSGGLDLYEVLPNSAPSAPWPAGA